MLDRHIRRIVDKAVRETIDSHLDAAIDRAIKNNPRFKFIKAMQLRMLSVDRTLHWRTAWNAAVGCLNDFLHDEKIAFGDPRYDWSEDGAVDLINEWEIAHWESAA